MGEWFHRVTGYSSARRFTCLTTSRRMSALLALASNHMPEVEVLIRGKQQVPVADLESFGKAGHPEG